MLDSVVFFIVTKDYLPAYIIPSSNGGSSYLTVITNHYRDPVEFSTES